MKSISKQRLLRAGVFTLIFILNYWLFTTFVGFTSWKVFLISALCFTGVDYCLSKLMKAGRWKKYFYKEEMKDGGTS